MGKREIMNATVSRVPEGLQIRLHSPELARLLDQCTDSREVGSNELGCGPSGSVAVYTICPAIKVALEDIAFATWGSGSWFVDGDVINLAKIFRPAMRDGYTATWPVAATDLTLERTAVAIETFARNLIASLQPASHEIRLTVADAGPTLPAVGGVQ